MAKKKKTLAVFEDINFFEWPTWLLDEKSQKKEHTVKDSFTMASITSLPTQFDRKVLSNVLSFIIKGEKVVGQEVTTTRYAIASMIYDRKVKDSYTIDRVYEALEKYKCTTFFFRGVFYSDKNRTRRTFSYIDDVILDETTKELYVKFNQQFLRMLKESKYTKWLNLKVYNSLRLPISNRLYEILCKSLEYNSSWSIGLQNLSEKITLQKRQKADCYYASDVLAIIKSGIDEISQKSPFNFEFSYNKENDVVTFERTKKAKASSRRLSMSPDLASYGGHRASPRKAKAKQTQGTFAPAVIDDASKKQKEKESAALKAAYLKKFKSLPSNEKQAIIDAANNNSYLDILPDQETKIYAHMKAQCELL